MSSGAGEVPPRVRIGPLEDAAARVAPAWPQYGNLSAAEVNDPVLSDLFEGIPGSPAFTMWIPGGRSGRVPMHRVAQEAFFRVIADVAKSVIPENRLNDIVEIMFFRDEVKFMLKPKGKGSREEVTAPFEHVNNPTAVPLDDIKGGAPNVLPDIERGSREIQWLREMYYDPAHPGRVPLIDLRPRRVFVRERPAPRVSRGVKDFLNMLILQHNVRGTPVGDLIDPVRMRPRRARPEESSAVLDEIWGAHGSEARAERRPE